MGTLMDGLKSLVTSQLIDKAAKQLGEKESGIENAISGLTGTVMHGLADKSNDSSAFGDLFTSLSSNKTEGFLNDLGGLLEGGNVAQGDPKDVAGGFLGQIFGDKVADIISAVAGATGISRSSSSGLLGMVGPMIMGYLGKRIIGDGLDAAGLKSLLVAEKSSFAAAVPAQVQPMLGMAPQVKAAPAAVAANQVETKKAGFGWLWPLLIVLAGIALLLFLLRGCSDDTDRAVEPAGNETSGYSYDLDGYTLQGNADGVEAGLINFIESGKEPCTDADCWFNFDRLTFATGSANLDLASSDAQLENIAQILKARPDVSLKIAGYTDTTGSEDLNMTLSQQRADAVIAEVIGRGVSEDRLAGEGFGSQFPVASNDTAEGRAQNRRIAVRVR